MESAWQTIRTLHIGRTRARRPAVGAAEPWQILLVVTALVVIAVLLHRPPGRGPFRRTPWAKRWRRAPASCRELQAQAAQAEKRPPQAEAMVSRPRWSGKRR
jgi:hypothetical protein